MARRRYTPKLKAQVVLEVFAGKRTPGQIAKAYGVHPNLVGLWKRRFIERVPDIPAEALDARVLYDELCCVRGEMENRIKEQSVVSRCTLSCVPGRWADKPWYLVIRSRR